MTRPTTAELTKLQVVCSLFHPLVGGDLYLARQIKESIEAALPEEVDQAKTFLEKAQKLALQMNACAPQSAISHVDLSGTPFSMLIFRAKLLFAVKSICRFNKATVVLSGLKEALCPEGRRWSPKKAQEYEDAITFARAFCQQRSRPTSRIHLVIY
ncbi:MAG: hypothetical protein AAGB46_09150 [Verrucomicrobiota bacterium]